MKRILLIAAAWLLTISNASAVTDSAAFTVSATAICQNGYITITNTSTTPNPSRTSYTWNFGYGASPANSYDAHPSGYINYGYAGAPTISMYMYDSVTGITRSASQIISVMATPYFTSSSVSPSDGAITCLHDSVVLSCTLGFPAMLVWTAPGGSTDTAAADTVRSGGMYSVVAVSSLGCASHPMSFYITAPPIPSAAITVYGDGGFTSSADSVRICKSSHPSLSISPSGPVASVAWNTGATYWSIPADSTRKYSVTVTDIYGCSAKDSVYITALASPSDSLTIYPSHRVCIGDTVTISLPRASGYHYLWSDGSTTDTFKTTSWTGYNATVTDANGCTASTGYRFVDYNSLPYPNILSSTCSLTVAVIDPGAHYQWYQYTSPMSGATSTLYIVPSTNFYKVLETDTNGCQAFSPMLSVTACPTFDSCTVHPQPTPTVGIGLPCVVASTVTADTFQWYRNSVPISGSDTQYLAITLPGYYSVRATNHWGCASTSSAVLDSCGGSIAVSDTCTLHPQPVPSVITSIACVVGSTEAADTFVWYRNGIAIALSDTQFFHIALPGFYSVKCTNHWGCSATSATVADSCPVAPPVDTCLAHPQDIPTVVTGINCHLASSVTADLFQWYKDGTAIPSSNTQFLTISENGFYSVKATNSWGCSETSASAMGGCDLTSVPSVNKDQASPVIYPNPATEEVTIQVKGQFSAVVRTLTGRDMAHAEGTSSVVIPIKDMPSGMYVIEVHTQQGIFNSKLIKE